MDQSSDPVKARLAHGSGEEMGRIVEDACPLYCNVPTYKSQTWRHEPLAEEHTGMSSWQQISESNSVPLLHEDRYPFKPTLYDTESSMSLQHYSKTPCLALPSRSTDHSLIRRIIRRGLISSLSLLLAACSFLPTLLNPLLAGVHRACSN